MKSKKQNAANLVELIADLNEEEALRIVKQKLDAGEDAIEILEMSRDALTIVGERFKNGEYFIPELVMAGEIFRKISELVKPKIKKAEIKRLGKVVIGTVQHDIHDLGKDIVKFMLEINGFEVHDLGVDVPPEKFVEAIKKIKPQVVGLSGLLTLAFESMKKTVEAIEKAGLRSKVKIMIGGAQVDEYILKYVGADAYGKNAMEAVELCKKWIGGGK